MATLRIDLALPFPAYEQIIRGLRGLLVSGEFQAGEQLPPVRQLAVDLGVNHNTVAEAYRTLAKEGWLELRQGRGATVLERTSPKATRADYAQFRRELHELSAKAVADGLARDIIANELQSIAESIRGEKKA
jgi:GntR family transcriptional regulator